MDKLKEIVQKVVEAVVNFYSHNTHLLFGTVGFVIGFVVAKLL